MKIFYSGVRHGYPIPEEVLPKANAMVAFLDFQKHRKIAMKRFKMNAIKARNRKPAK